MASATPLDHDDGRRDWHRRSKMDGRDCWSTERKPGAIAAAIRTLVGSPALAQAIGAAARAAVQRSFGWSRTAERFEAAYGRALAFKSLPS